MRQVSFGFLLLEDFKSFRGKHEIELSMGPGLKYISGSNKVNPRLGSNGSGKTTIWDAVIWCLTGYSIRGHRASDLASWGAKSCHVLLGMEIDDVVVTIERFGSPNRLLINDEPAEQYEVDRLLLSRQRLLHSVIFGQSVRFFYNLSVPERGLILDEIMELGLWLKLAEKANTKSTEAGKQLIEISGNIKYSQGVLANSLQQEANIVGLNQSWQANWRTEIDTELHKLEEQENTLKGHQNYLAKIAEEISGLPDLEAMYRKLQEKIEHFNKVRTDIALCWASDTAIMQQLIFFQNHSTCSQCQQRITDEFRKRKIASIEYTIKEIERYRLELVKVEEKASKAVTELQQEYNQAMDNKSRLDMETHSTMEYIKQQATSISTLTQNIQSRIAHPSNPYTEYLNQQRATIAKLKADIANLETFYKDVEGEQMKYDYWRTGFRKVRLFQVKQVLARLQLETANAASTLGIGDWLIEYSTEVETKSGTTKPGVHITVKAPDGYKIAEESGGEEQRVKLAVACGFSSLIQEMAGLKFNFEAWDEPSAWLSAEGIDDMLDQLKDRAESLQRSIWLLDHRVADQTVFDEVLHVTKTESGSSIT